MTIRQYESADLPQIQRMWNEIHWATSAEQKAALEHFVADSDVAVATLNGEVEAMAAAHTGKMRFLNHDLDASVVTAVTTSLVGRKQGLAQQVTARVVTNAIDAGAEVALLGMFEQGFYDRLGFGTGSYIQRLSFDPASLRSPAAYRPPTRLNSDQWEHIHEAHLQRLRQHGGVVIDAPSFTRAEMDARPDSFVWGYYDGDRLTHFIWGKIAGEDGPLRIDLISYETTHQLMELLALIQVLGDQFRSVVMVEPSEIQLFDLLRYPIRQLIATRKGDHQSAHSAIAWWQLRILDVFAVVSRLTWDGDPIAFNVTLSDPLDDVVAGKGLSGQYLIEIGKSSHIESVSTPNADLPTLTASVNAFSRMWFGVRPASSLALTDQLTGPKRLMSQLDAALRLPSPQPGMFF